MFNFNFKKMLRDDTEDSLTYIHGNTPEFTPDIAELQSRLWNWVFIPDECMLTNPKHSLVKEGASGFYPFYEDAYTSDRFTFLEKKLGKESTCLVFKNIDDPDLPVWMQKEYRISGELYALSGKQIISLDNHKKNTVYCNRQKININIPFTMKQRTRSQTYNGVWSSTYSTSKWHLTSVEAFVYIQRMDYWRDQLIHLDNFSPVKVMNEPDRIYVRKYYDYKFQNI